MRLIDLLARAVEMRVSDIHYKTGSAPWIRIDGEISPIEDDVPIGEAEMKEFIEAIIPDRLVDCYAGMDEVDFAYNIENVGRYRVNVYRQREKLSAAIRVVSVKPVEIDDLNLPKAIQKVALEPRGLILVTGVTGSGKSTTLAGMIELVNRNLHRHIITIEDPIEFVYADKQSIIDQREVGIDTDSYSTALKYILRQDPDVILVGEMRDLETVKAAVSAAETGHLVLSTLHTLDAAETINRIIDLFPSGQQMQVRYQLAATLKGIVSQRLLPHKSGSGRVPAVEVLIMTGRIHDFIIDPKETYNIPQAIAEGDFYGMQTFDQSLLKLIMADMITYEDAVEVCTNPQDFRLMLQQEGFDVEHDPLTGDSFRGGLGEAPAAGHGSGEMQTVKQEGKPAAGKPGGIGIDSRPLGTVAPAAAPAGGPMKPQPHIKTDGNVKIESRPLGTAAPAQENPAVKPQKPTDGDSIYGS